jgi:protein phosphatase PTC1
MSDQEAVNLIFGVDDPKEAAELLVHQALENLSTDNLSAVVIRFQHAKLTLSKAESEEIIFDNDKTPTPRSVSANFSSETFQT